MFWDDDDITPKTKRSVGRPLENPFPSEEVEEEFVSRGASMIERFYHPAGPNTRLDFVFGPGGAMSKTLFWSLVFIYYVQKKGMKNNIQGYLSAVQRHFGAAVASDRAGITKKIAFLDNYYVHCIATHPMSGAEGRVQEKLRKQYQYIVRRWEETTAPNCNT